MRQRAFCQENFRDFGSERLKNLKHVGILSHVQSNQARICSEKFFLYFSVGLTTRPTGRNRALLYREAEDRERAPVSGDDTHPRSD